jgi:hypothetical protein
VMFAASQGKGLSQIVGWAGDAHEQGAQELTTDNVAEGHGSPAVNISDEQDHEHETYQDGEDASEEKQTQNTGERVEESDAQSNHHTGVNGGSKPLSSELEISVSNSTEAPDGNARIDAADSGSKNANAEEQSAEHSVSKDEASRSVMNSPEAAEHSIQDKSPHIVDNSSPHKMASTKGSVVANDDDDIIDYSEDEDDVPPQPISFVSDDQDRQAMHESDIESTNGQHTVPNTDNHHNEAYSETADNDADQNSGEGEHDEEVEEEGGGEEEEEEEAEEGEGEGNQETEEGEVEQEEDGKQETEEGEVDERQEVEVEPAEDVEEPFEKVNEAPTADTGVEIGHASNNDFGGRGEIDQPPSSDQGDSSEYLVNQDVDSSGSTNTMLNSEDIDANTGFFEAADVSLENAQAFDQSYYDDGQNLIADSTDIGETGKQFDIAQDEIATDFSGGNYGDSRDVEHNFVADESHGQDEDGEAEFEISFEDIHEDPATPQTADETLASQETPGKRPRDEEEESSRDKQATQGQSM